MEKSNMKLKLGILLLFSMRTVYSMASSFDLDISDIKEDLDVTNEFTSTRSEA